MKKLNHVGVFSFSKGARQAAAAAGWATLVAGGATGGTLGGTQGERRDAVVWHTFDGSQSVFFDKLVDEFNAMRGEQNIRVRAETGMELPQALIEQLEDGDPPDAVLAPSDLIGLARTLRLSEVPDDVAGSRFGREIATSVELDGRPFGAPILEGNHLMLLYNRRLVSKPSADFAAMTAEAPALAKDGVKLIAWQFQEPYLFAAFLHAFDAFPLKTSKMPATVEFESKSPDQGMAAALTRYRMLADSGLVDRDCDYGCVTRDFHEGRYAYAIDGDWSVLAAAAALGDDLGLAALPAIDGRPLISLSATHALIFPGQALEGERRDLLLAFARFLQSAAVQRRWHSEARRLPVDLEASRVTPTGTAPADRRADDMRQLLRHSRRVPVAEGMALAWPALRKGLRLYLAGVLSTNNASNYMQKLVDGAVATRREPPP